MFLQYLKYKTYQSKSNTVFLKSWHNMKYELVSNRQPLQCIVDAGNW